MAADLAGTPSAGFAVQVCGDCHLMNFGGFATPERNIVFDINDFDETLPGPWEWDVKRLAASFVLASRANGFSDSAARETAVACTRAYRKGMQRFAKTRSLDLWSMRFGPEQLLGEIRDPQVRAQAKRRLEKAASTRGSDVAYPKLVESSHGEIRIRDNPPLIFHPQVGNTENLQSMADDFLRLYRESLSDDRKVLLDRYRLVDVAIKVVGIGSVGTRCWIALLMTSANEPLFLQVKQAGPSVLEPYAGKSRYTHGGQRVVVGQRLMQAASDIFLGWASGPGGDFYVRQLRDAKISALVDTFDPSTMSVYARFCGENLARAHAKTGDPRTISGYLGKSDAFDEAIGKFARAYADQAERDYDALKAAVRSGRIEAYTEDD